MTSFAWVAAFGALGAAARFGTELIWPLRLDGFPVATFVINGVGSFLAGAIYAMLDSRGLLDSAFRLALMTGFLGGFTTFSAYSLQVVQLGQDSRFSTAALYAVLSPACGVVGAALGVWIARKWIG